ncbi:hypothetical protein ACWEIJ_36300 [Lentzea sp. NPDC004789]
MNGKGKPKAITWCVDFALFPDDTVLGPKFTLAGMTFEDLPGAPGASFVNQTKGVRALQFFDPGIDVELLVVVPWVRVRVGQFNKPFLIEALDVNGTVVHSVTTSFPDQYGTVVLTGDGISRFRCTGGGHEGSIASVCTPL